VSLKLKTGYKRFNRYWKDDMDLFKMELKTLPGSWFYVKRYNPRAAIYKRKTLPGEPERETERVAK